MPTRLRPDSDVFEKMTRDELLYWIHNECRANEPTKSKLLFMKWELASRTHQVLSETVCSQMSEYTSLPREKRTIPKWLAIQKISDREKKQWKKCETLYKEYRRTFDEEYPNKVHYGS